MFHSKLGLPSCGGASWENEMMRMMITGPEPNNGGCVCVCVCDQRHRHSRHYQTTTITSITTTTITSTKFPNITKTTINKTTRTVNIINTAYQLQHNKYSSTFTINMHYLVLGRIRDLNTASSKDPRWNQLIQYIEIFSGGQAALRCEGSPTFLGMTSSPSSGWC